MPENIEIEINSAVNELINDFDNNNNLDSELYSIWKHIYDLKEIKLDNKINEFITQVRNNADILYDIIDNILMDMHYALKIDILENMMIYACGAMYTACEKLIRNIKGEML